MKTKEEKINEIMSVINKYSRVDARVTELTELGYVCCERRCGSGGKGRVIEMKNETRIQIGYGHSSNNYAMVVILSK
jgi:hypothetical protein